MALHDLGVKFTEATDGAGSFFLQTALQIKGEDHTLTEFNAAVLLADAEFVLDMNLNWGLVLELNLLCRSTSKSASGCLHTTLSDVLSGNNAVCELNTTVQSAFSLAIFYVTRDDTLNLLV